MGYEFSKWTRLAKECYFKGCLCRNCTVYSTCENNNFEMKNSIITLVRNIGRPKVSQGDYFGTLNSERW